jgi:SAM-dependent methyltransferase
MTTTSQLFQGGSTPPTLPELYEKHLVDPLFRPFATAMIEAAALKPGERVLDVACGTGIVSRLAQQRVGTNGAVVGVDISPAMLAVARQTAPLVEFRLGDAAALPLEHGEAFDVALCHQGFQFFPDKSAAARELRGALVSEGRALIATWLPLSESGAFFDMTSVAERHLGPINDRRHSFGNPDSLIRAMSEAGLKGVRVVTVTRRLSFDDPEPLVRLNAMALVGMSRGAGELAPAQHAALVEAIVADCEPVVARYAEGDGMSFELSTNLATGIA